MLSRRKAKPFKFEAKVFISAPAEQVYGALNLRSPNNRYVRRGMSLTPQEGSDDTFVVTDDDMPGFTFFFTEVLAVPHSRYSLTTRFPEGQVAGAVTGDDSDYTLTPAGEGRCQVTYKGALHLVPMTKKERRKEEAMLLLSINDDLARLKALIEEGSEAAAKAGALDEFLDKLEAHADKDSTGDPSCEVC